MNAGILKKLAGQTAIYGLSSIIGRLLNYLLVPIYTRVFTEQAQYGIVTELYSYIGFFMVVFTYGMETAFFRYSKDSNEDKISVFSTIMLSMLVSTVLFSGLLIIAAPYLAELIRLENYAHFIVYLALILAFDTLTAVPFAKLRYEEKAWRFAAIKLTNIGLNIGLVLFFIKLCPLIAPSYPIINTFYQPDIGIGYIFISNLVASSITVLLLWPEFKQVQFRFNKQLWHTMMRYALPLVIVGFAGTINEMLDRIILKYLLPYDETTNQGMVGIYGACYKISILMTLFTQAFRFAAEPFFFASAKQKNALAIYAKSMQYFVMVGGLIFVGVVAFLDIFQYFIGPNYRSGLVVVPYLLLANLFLGIYYNLSIWYKLTDKTTIGAYIAIGGALITLILNVVLIPHIGYLGSAIATLICYISMVGASYLLCQRHYPIPYPMMRIVGYLLMATVLVLIHELTIKPIASLQWAYFARVLLVVAYIVAVILSDKTIVRFIKRKLFA